MAVSNIYVGLEIGTSKVCMVVGEVRGDGAIKILGVGQHPAAGVRKGEIVDPETVRTCLHDALARAEERSDVDEEGVDLNHAAFRRAISTMRKHGDRISRIVDDMLTISKLENASSLLNVDPFDLRHSLDETVSQLTPLIEEHHAEVEIMADPSEGWILEGDRYYWDQIFFNLIENALKQNASRKLKIDIAIRSENGRYLITIADDGIGIPTADIPLIFKRFYRVQKHHAQSQVKGTGLGLSIVKRAVEAHNGEISVQSQPGIETVFTISVPHQSMQPVGHRSQSADS